MNRRACLILLLLAACSQPIQPGLDPVGSGRVESGEPVPTLAGEWRVAGIDDKSFDEAYGLALSADRSDIWWSPRCAGFVRSYALDGRSIRVRPKAQGGANEAKNVPACLVAEPARLREIFDVLDAADHLVRMPNNALEISGGGRSLTLFSQ